MILARRILPFIVTLLLALLYVELFFQPTLYVWWSAGIGIVALASVAFMTKWKFASVHFWWALFPLVSFLFGGTGLLFFLDQPLYRILWVIFLVMMVGFYFEDLFMYYYQPQKYSPLSLARLSFVMNIVASFSLFSFLFGYQLIGLVQSWLLPLIAMAYAMAMMTHMLWSYKIWGPHAGWVILLFGLFTAELVWILHFLPTVYFVNGILVGIVLYCLASLVQMKFRQIINRALTLRYVLISSMLVLSILSTSQWT